MHIEQPENGLNRDGSRRGPVFWVIPPYKHDRFDKRRSDKRRW